MEFADCTRIPFFFEPNFDAVVKPLDAALRINDKEDKEKGEELRQSIVYGDFLKSKVGNNFSTNVDIATTE